METTAHLDAGTMKCAVDTPCLVLMRARAIVGSIPHGFRRQNLAGSLDDARQLTAEAGLHPQSLETFLAAERPLR